MNPRDNHARHDRHRSPFALWGWVMLLVVALSAVPTEGQARSRLVGSAFDPASVSVALNPKKPKVKAKASLHAADGRELHGSAPDGPPATLAPSPPLSASTQGAADTGSRIARTEVVHVPESFARAHGARAPPTA